MHSYLSILGLRSRTYSVHRQVLDKDSPQFLMALTQASRELGLQEYYRDCVRPLFSMPTTQWPTCCGGGCEPCMQTLVAVALRVYRLLNVGPDGDAKTRV